jgi:hypothetical protein
MLYSAPQPQRKIYRIKDTLELFNRISQLRITQCLRLRLPCGRLRWRWPLSRRLLTECLDELAGLPLAAAAPTRPNGLDGHLANTRYVICNCEMQEYLFSWFYKH